MTKKFDTPFMHKVFRYKNLSEIPKGPPTNLVGTVRQKNIKEKKLNSYTANTEFRLHNFKSARHAGKFGTNGALIG